MPARQAGHFRAAEVFNPSRLLVIVIMVMIIADIHQMIHSLFVTPTITFAIIFPRALRYVGVPIFLAIIHVGSAMIVKILARALDSIVITLPLDLTKLLWRRIPSVLCI